MNAPVKSVVDTIDYKDWFVKEWKIKFLLSERQLSEIKKLSRVDNWYEDPVVADTYFDRLCVCFDSIQKFYESFGTLPQIGDRLFDEDTGMKVQERSIDGNMMTITFTLSV